MAYLPVSQLFDNASISIAKGYRQTVYRIDIRIKLMKIWVICQIFPLGMQVRKQLLRAFGISAIAPASSKFSVP